MGGPIVTPEERDRIAEFLKDGRTYSEIQRITKRSPGTIRTIQRELDIQLQNQFGRALSVRHRRDDYDWAVPVRMYAGTGAHIDPTYPEIRELMRKAKNDGLNHAELAARIGKSQALVQKWASELAKLHQNSAA